MGLGASPDQAPAGEASAGNFGNFRHAGTALFFFSLRSFLFVPSLFLSRLKQLLLLVSFDVLLFLSSLLLLLPSLAILTLPSF